MITIKKIPNEQPYLGWEYDYLVYVNNKLYLTFDDADEAENHVDKFLNFLKAAKIEYEMVE